MIIAGILALTLPQGSLRTHNYGRPRGRRRRLLHIDYGRKPSPPFYRIFTAPIEVLASDDAVTIIGIIIFIVLISGSIGLLNQSGIMSYAMERVVEKTKKTVIACCCLSPFFMFFGAFVGVSFEETLH